MAGCTAFIVYPVSTDEFIPEARYSGLAGVDRISRFHALNQKAVARKVADSIGKRYEDVRFVVTHLGTKDMGELEDRVSVGDRAARGVVEAFAFQVAKDIGSMAAVCSGRVDRVIITGGMARFDLLTELIRSRIAFIAPVEIVPGEEEMSALAEGATRVLKGEAPALDYSEEKRDRACRESG
ncbi:MAG: hypothetical protein LBG12_13975 [Synergistaceae bacterium]|jgi:butyrate kinase|nr:hypothetical protein [Synergistaceae bacterium]